MSFRCELSLLANLLNAVCLCVRVFVGKLTHTFRGIREPTQTYTQWGKQRTSPRLATPTFLYAGGVFICAFEWFTPNCLPAIAILPQHPQPHPHPFTCHSPVFMAFLCACKYICFHFTLLKTVF